MINRLRNRFIRIATLSVSAVMLLLTVILNTANFISTDSDLRDTLTLIYENEGTIPTASHTAGSSPTAGTSGTPKDPPADTASDTPPEASSDQPSDAPSGVPSDAPQKKDRPSGPFTAETPYSTRYFVLRYQDDGTLTMADLDKIAAVSEEDTDEYLAAAVAHGPGYGYYGQYRFFAAHTGRPEHRHFSGQLPGFPLYEAGVGLVSGRRHRLHPAGAPAGGPAVPQGH